MQSYNKLFIKQLFFNTENGDEVRSDLSLFARKFLGSLLVPGKQFIQFALCLIYSILRILYLILCLIQLPVRIGFLVRHNLLLNWSDHNSV